jgi:hypothetical protein
LTAINVRIYFSLIDAAQRRDEMTAALTTAAATLARELARMPRDTLSDCQEIDLAIAAILDMLIEGADDTDAPCVLQDAAAHLRATVEQDRERQAMREAA